MDLRKILIITLYLLISSSQNLVFSQDAVDNSTEVAKDESFQVKLAPDIGYVKPYIPVIQPPVLKKAWIPNHTFEQDSDVFVLGTWVFIKIIDDTWFLEQEIKDKGTIPIVIPIVGENK